MYVRNYVATVAAVSERRVTTVAKAYQPSICAGMPI